MRESEQNIIVEQVHQVNASVLATNCDNINDWALYDGLNRAWKSELVDALLLDHVPQFHLLASVEEHFVHVSDWMDETSQVSILKLLTLDHLSRLCVERQELSILTK